MGFLALPPLWQSPELPRVSLSGCPQADGESCLGKLRRRHFGPPGRRSPPLSGGRLGNDDVRRQWLYLWLVHLRGLSFLIGLYGLWVFCHPVEWSPLVLHSPSVCFYPVPLCISFFFQSPSLGLIFPAPAGKQNPLARQEWLLWSHRHDHLSWPVGKISEAGNSRIVLHRHSSVSRVICTCWITSASLLNVADYPFIKATYSTFTCPHMHTQFMWDFFPANSWQIQNFSNQMLVSTFEVVTLSLL